MACGRQAGGGQRQRGVQVVHLADVAGDDEEVGQGGRHACLVVEKGKSEDQEENGKLVFGFGGFRERKP